MVVDFLQTKIDAFINSYAFKKICADFNVICAYISGSNCLQTAYSADSDVDIIVLVKDAGVSFKSQFRMKHCHWMINGLDLYTAETPEINGRNNQVKKYFCLAQDYFVTLDNIIYINEDLRADFEQWFNTTRTTVALNSAAELLTNCNTLMGLSDALDEFDSSIASNAYHLAICTQVVTNNLIPGQLINVRKCVSYEELAAAFKNIDFGEYEWIKQLNYFAPIMK